MNKHKVTRRSLTAKEINEITLLHDELKSNHYSGLNQSESSAEFKQFCSMINVFKLELSIYQGLQSSGFSSRVM